jgi:antitoxin VapB
MSFEVVDIEIRNDFQDIKIPEKFKIDDNKVYLKKTGNVIYIIPYHDAWKSLIDSTSDFSDDFMEKRNQPLDQQERETFDT